MDISDPARSARSTMPTLKDLGDFSVVNDMPVMDVAVAIVDAKDALLQTLVGLISAPSMDLLLLKSTNDTKRRDSPSNATRRVIVSSSAKR
jgi:hypothetical protein